SQHLPIVVLCGPEEAGRRGLQVGQSENSGRLRRCFPLLVARSPPLCRRWFQDQSSTATAVLRLCTPGQDGLLSARLAQLPLSAPLPAALRFQPSSHGNERLSAIAHMEVLEPDDAVVYDRGYFSYLLLHRHRQAGIHAIFR